MLESPGFSELELWLLLSQSQWTLSVFYGMLASFWILSLAYPIQYHGLPFSLGTSKKGHYWGNCEAEMIWFLIVALQLCRVSAVGAGLSCGCRVRETLRQDTSGSMSGEESDSPLRHPGASGHSLFLSCSWGFHVWCVWFPILLFYSHFLVNCSPVSEVWLEAGACLPLL